MEVFHPGGAAQFSAAWAESADAAGFLACADLFHLNAHAEGFCQHFDELAEIHAAFGNIIEDGLSAVALIFHVADLHFQSQVFGILAGLYHRFVFTTFCGLVFFEVGFRGDAVEAFDLVFTLQPSLEHLDLGQSACQRDDADVVSGRGLHGNAVTLFDFQVIDVVVVSLAGVLELDFHQIRYLLVVRQVGQVVKDIVLAIMPHVPTFS